MKLIYLQVLVCLLFSNVLFGVFLVSQESEQNDGSDTTNNLLDSPFLSDDDFADLDLIDDEDIVESEEIAYNDSIVIDSLVLYIDNNIYENPDINDEHLAGSTDPLLVMKELSFRRGDVMKFALFQKRIYLSQHNLEGSQYIYMESNIIEYINLEEEDQDANKKLKVFVTVKQGFPFVFGGGNAYAVFGINHPFGLRSTFYGGGNRVEANLRYENIPLGSQADSFGRVFLDLGSDLFLYWLAPPLHGLPYSALLYGTKLYTGFNFNPAVRLETGFGFFGLDTIDGRESSLLDLNNAGLPAPDAGATYTVDFRNSLLIQQRLGHSGLFASFLELEIPFMLGIGISPDQSISLDSIYDVAAARIEGQVATFFGVHHALHFVAGFGSNIVSNNIPFIAKTNIRGNFYDNTFVNLTRRGTYPDSVSIGNKGYSSSLEYRVGWFRANIFSLESFLFFDVGAAADNYEDLSKNTRYSFGPGLTFHFFSPVGLQFKTSYVFGGTLLGQIDGDPFSFALEVSAKR